MSVPSQQNHPSLIKGDTLGLSDQPGDLLWAQGPLSWLVWGREVVGREGKSGFRIRESSGLIPGLIL